MSNLLSIHNSKNQLGIGTNSINVSSSLTIKEDSKRYIVFNTGNDSIDTHRPIELEDETTLSTVKTHNISSAKLLYISSNNEISSLALSSSNYLKISNTGGLVLIDKTAPKLSNVTLESNNTFKLIAGIGNTVSLIFEPDETINTPTVSFSSGGNSITNSPSYSYNSGNGKWTASYVVHTSDTAGDITYTISFSDLANNSGSYTQNQTSEGKVSAKQLYVLIKVYDTTLTVNTTRWLLHYSSSSSSTHNQIYATWDDNWDTLGGVSWDDNDVQPDEHIWKITTHDDSGTLRYVIKNTVQSNGMWLGGSYPMTNNRLSTSSYDGNRYVNLTAHSSQPNTFKVTTISSSGTTYTAFAGHHSNNSTTYILYDPSYKDGYSKTTTNIYFTMVPI